MKVDYASTRVRLDDMDRRIERIGVGNGCATTIRFAREGQGFDRFIASAEETAAMAAQEGGECEPFAAYVTREATLAAG